MKKFSLYILPACLTLAFFFLITEKSISQADQESKVDTTAHSDNDGASPYVAGLTAGRARSLVGGVVALISLIIGWRVKVRSAVSSGSKSWPIAGLVLGLIAIALSVVHLANVTGGFGTGGGKAGAIVALVLGLIGTSLSGLALRRKRK